MVLSVMHCLKALVIQNASNIIKIKSVWRVSPDTEERPDVDEKLVEIVHKGDFAVSVYCHAECGWSEAVEGLEQTLLVIRF